MRQGRKNSVEQNSMLADNKNIPALILTLIEAVTDENPILITPIWTVMFTD